MSAEENKHDGWRYDKDLDGIEDETIQKLVKKTKEWVQN